MMKASGSLIAVAVMMIVLVGACSPDGAVPATTSPSESTLTEPTPTEPPSTTESPATTSPVAHLLDQANPKAYPLHVNPMPDFRSYIDFKDIFYPDESDWGVLLGRRLDEPGLGIVFTCRKPGTEDIDLVVATAADDHPSTIAAVVEAYASEAGCEPGFPTPPVDCLGLDSDPVSCREGEGDGG